MQKKMRFILAGLFLFSLAGLASCVTAAPSDSIVMSIQEKLKDAGYDPGPIDGVWGKTTEAALRRYQSDNSLPDTGILDSETSSKLGLDASTTDLPPQDIVDLIASKKIEVQTEGSGIQSVTIRVKPRVPYALTVRVPVGTFFVSRNSASQNMVSTAESVQRVSTGDWTTVSAPAACANRPRDIPASGDSFTVRKSPNQTDLARLMPFLDAASASYSVRQAAVWIVTDNADYDDLGILVASQYGSPFGGRRVINEEEAAQAMRICDESGINITKKAIWRDRKAILAGLTDGDLKTWLSQKK